MPTSSDAPTKTSWVLWYLQVLLHITGFARLIVIQQKIYVRNFLDLDATLPNSNLIQAGEMAQCTDCLLNLGSYIHVKAGPIGVHL